MSGYGDGGYGGGGVDPDALTRLQAYTNADASDTDFLGECIAQASALVARFVGTATVPDEVSDRAVLECASELFHRKQAPNGIPQFATIDGASPIRVARDPMMATYPLLTPYVGTGMA